MAANVVALATGLAAHVFLRGRYLALEHDLDENNGPQPHFSHRVLNRIVRDARADAQRPQECNVQAIVEDAIRRVKSCGKAPGILTSNESFARRCLDIGALFVAVGSDSGLLARGSEALLRRFRAGE